MSLALIQDETNEGVDEISNSGEVQLAGLVENPPIVSMPPSARGLKRQHSPTLPSDCFC